MERGFPLCCHCFFRPTDCNRMTFSEGRDVTARLKHAFSSFLKYQFAGPFESYLGDVYFILLYNLLRLFLLYK